MILFQVDLRLIRKMSNKFMTLFQSKGSLRLIKLFNRELTTSRCASARIAGLDREPKAPIVKTPIPGPKSKKLFDELNTIQVRSCFHSQRLEFK